MYQLRRGYEVDVTVSFVDDIGDPAPVDGVPDWIVDGVAFEIFPAADGMTAVLQAVGDMIGERATLTVSADADLGDGVIGVRVDEELQVVSGQATTASFGFGTPRPISGEG